MIEGSDTFGFKLCLLKSLLRRGLQKENFFSEFDPPFNGDLPSDFCLLDSIVVFTVDLC